MILLISRDQELSASFQRDLKPEGFEIISISDCQEAYFHIYNNKNVEMLIVDFNNFKNKATDFIQKLKSTPELRFIPLICIVNREKVVEQLIAFELGADEFIYMPYSTPEIQLKLRSIKRLLDLQKKIKKQEEELNILKNAQKILVTLSHYINNSLTPLYTLVQIIDERNPSDASRLKLFVKQTVEFINKVLSSANKLVQSGEMKVVKNGAYKDLLLDIEHELKLLQEKQAK